MGPFTFFFLKILTYLSQDPFGGYNNNEMLYTIIRKYIEIKDRMIEWRCNFYKKFTL